MTAKIRHESIPRCFVIQPFDNGAFDKRYEDVMRPAIKAAGLEPYRVDRDPSVQIPIDEIEQGIKESAICVADITTDNPNVWYEVGFASAAQRPVCLICGPDRVGPFPFDVRQRHVIRYKTDSSSDFKEMRAELTARLRAFLDRLTGTCKDNIWLDAASMNEERITRERQALSEGAAHYNTDSGDNYTYRSVAAAVRSIFAIFHVRSAGSIEFWYKPWKPKYWLLNAQVAKRLTESGGEFVRVFRIGSDAISKSNVCELTELLDAQSIAGIDVRLAIEFGSADEYQKQPDLVWVDDSRLHVFDPPLDHTRHIHVTLLHDRSSDTRKHVELIKSVLERAQCWNTDADSPDRLVMIQTLNKIAIH